MFNLRFIFVLASLCVLISAGHAIADTEISTEKTKYLQPSKMENAVAAVSMTLLDRWTTGPCRALHQNGETLFAGNGASIDILDVADLQHPRLLSRIHTNTVVAGIISVDNFLTVVSSGRIVIFDVNDPTAPSELGSCTTPEFPPYPGSIRLTYYRNHIYYELPVQYSRQLCSVDISDPSHPVKTIDQNIEPNSINTDGNYLYIASDQPDLRIYEDDNGELNQISSLNCDGRLKGMFFIGDSLFLTGDQSYVADVSNPFNPELLCEIPFSGGVVFNCGYKVYTFQFQPNRLSIYDLCDINNAQRVAYIECVEPLTSLCLFDSVLAIAAGSFGVMFCNEQEDSLVFASAYRTGGNPRDLAVQDGFLYTATQRNGMQIIDISDPNNIEEVGSYQSQPFDSEFARDVEVVGNTAWLSNFHGLTSFDVTDKSSPMIISNHESFSPRDFVIRNNFAYLCTRAGIFIYDITDPADLTLVGTLEMDELYSGDDICADGDFLYWVNELDGMSIVDISDPAHPTFVSNYDYDNIEEATNVDVSDGYAYVTFSQMQRYAIDQLIVFDVGDPFNPVEVGCYPYTQNGDSLSHVYVDGEYAYVTWRYHGLEVLDISNPARPEKVASFDTDSFANTVTVHENIAYVGDTDNGVYIIRNDLLSGVSERKKPTPTQCRIVANYPNPFNNAFNIMLPPENRGTVSVSIFDMNGRKIFQTNHSSNAGVINVDASKFSTGEYLIHLKSDKFSQTIPVSCLK